MFVRFVGSECQEHWSTVFKQCCDIKDFYLQLRTIIVDQEKSIDLALDEVFQNAKLFLGPIHVKKNMGPKLGSFKAAGLSLYEEALHALSRQVSGGFISKFSELQANYLNKLPKERIYASYSNLQYGILTFQAA